MEVLLRTLCESPSRRTRNILRRAAERFLESNVTGDGEVSVTLVNDSFIRALNKQYRQVDAATDVLAFPLASRLPVPLGDALGEVVISVDTARRQARRVGHPLRRELLLLLIHGLLHLLDYEDATPAGRRRMRRAEQRWLAVFSPTSDA